MSSPEYRVALSPKAEQDIENILRHTGETWGQAQLFTYRDNLADALTTIRDNPAIGHTSDELPRRIGSSWSALMSSSIDCGHR